MITVVLALCLCSSAPSSALTPHAPPPQEPTFPEIRAELLQMVGTEQYLRGKLVGRGAPRKLANAIEATDRYHAARLEEIVDEIGWPIRSKVGKEGAHAAWSLAQHAVFNPPFMQRCLFEMEDYYGTDEVEGVDYAYLCDRVRGVGTLEPLKFGIIHGLPIEDEHQVEQRRRAAGFTISLADYRRQPDYEPPTLDEVRDREREFERRYDESVARAEEALAKEDFESALQHFGQAMGCRGFIQTEDIYRNATLHARLNTPAGDFRTIQGIRSLAARGFHNLERLRTEAAFERLHGNELWTEILEVIAKYNVE